MTEQERPAAWVSAKPNLVAAYPSHVPMGLPLPTPEDDDERPDESYSL